MINNQATEASTAVSSSQPKTIQSQSEAASASSDQVTALRARALELEQGIAKDETEISSLQSAALTDKSVEKEISTIRKDLADKLTVFDSLRAQIEQLKPELESDKVVAKISDHLDFAQKNKEAYEDVLKFFAQETKEMIGENPTREDLLKMGFIHQARAGKEGAQFWGDQVEFWNAELAQGAPPEGIKDELAALYDQVFTLENQITDSFGSGAKEKQETAKSSLEEVKGKIAALRGSTQK